jgi:4-alpha-glucanotransferase
MLQRALRPLRQLAGLYGVQTEYDDAIGRRQRAEPETLLLILRLLGAPVATPDDVPAAIRARRQAWWQRGIAPVVVAWDGTPAWLKLRLPVASVMGVLSCHLQTEAGAVYQWDSPLADLPTLQAAEVEGVAYQAGRLALPETLPLGYHRLTLEIGGRQFETLLIVAPPKAYTPPNTAAQQEWGLFLPPYALHTERSWGSGDFADLEALAAWTAELGGTVVATLPLLSSFLDVPLEPSPYAPASRLFWNEFYIDLTRAPGLQECPTAQTLLHSPEFHTALTALRASPRVDYRHQMALKRQVLEALAHWFFSTGANQQADFQQFLAAQPAVADYARFRAVGERQRTPWPAWPLPLRDGVVAVGDYDEATWCYHLYVQWVAHEQLTAFAKHSQDLGVKLSLDLPLGAHPDSYDTWRERDIFVREVAAGNPPDPYFTKGQNWAFPPLHPEAIRAQGYRYCIAYLRHQLRHTGFLRLDHIMGLHRLFWIPQGLEPRHGVYVHYAAQELYAILNLESHRHQVCLVGENLGTVPAYVNTTMRRHQLLPMYVVQYELTPTSQGALGSVPRDAVASLNTHDMPPFAAYWQGLDIADRLALDLLTPEEEHSEQQTRQELLGALRHFLHHQGLLASPEAELPAVLGACLAFLSASPARVVLINLEDLWLETQAQNVPGTSTERPNWQHKARYSLETLRHMPQILTLLRTVNHLRKQATKTT